MNIGKRNKQRLPLRFMELSMQWYEKLKFARKVLKLSQRDVERQTGISNAYLCQIETGQIQEPSFFKMIALIKFYNLEVSDFIESEVLENEGTETVARLSNVLAGDASDKNTPFIDGGNLIRCSTCGRKYLKGAMCPKCFGIKN